MRLLRATTLVILGLLLAACSRDEGARLGKGAVVVRGLSALRVTMGKASQDGRSLALTWRGEPLAMAAEGGDERRYQSLWLKAACLVGDVVWVDDSPAIDGEAGPGERGSHPEAHLFGFHGLPGKPARCELVFHAQRPEGRAELGRACMQGGKLVVGRCTPALVEHPPVGEGLLRIDSVDTRMDTELSGGQSILVDWRVTALQPQRDGAWSRFESACAVDGGARQADSGCDTDLLEPGESRRCGQLPFTGQPLAATPQWCELRFYHLENLRLPPQRGPTYCFRPPRTTTLGPCSPAPP